MEDVMQFLLVAGILAFGIYKQFNKEKSNKPEKSMPMPTPEYEYEPEFEKPVIFEKPQKKQYHLPNHPFLRRVSEIPMLRIIYLNLSKK